MDEGLKPCPFCGRSDTPEIIRDDVTDRWFVVCASIPNYGCGARTMPKLEPECAIKAWNRRANDGE